MLDIAVIDCETTGLGEEARVVEVAVVTMTSVQAFRFVRRPRSSRPRVQSTIFVADEFCRCSHHERADEVGAGVRSARMFSLPTMQS